MMSVLGRMVVAWLLVASVAQAGGVVRGWGFLVDKLVADGVPRNRVLAVFRDERVDAFDGLQFSLQPRESHALYRPLRTSTTAARARRCLDRYASYFEAAERTYGVPASVVASIIQVESGCGANTGRSRILPALARLAMANEPRNVERNIARLSILHVDRAPASVSSFTRWRAQHLEDVFYPEVKAAFEIAERLGREPLEMRGSGSGAFGLPQFLPRSYLWYGVDGSGDGHVDLYDARDAIPSCAHYLQQYGWKADLTRAKRRDVIWGYNHSDAYIDTVHWLADEVQSPSPEPSREVSVKPKGQTAQRSTVKRTVTRSRRPAKTTAKAKATTKTVAKASETATPPPAKATKSASKATSSTPKATTTKATQTKATTAKAKTR
jgi:membrane-bound lytic murein transglycosylase B